MLPNTIYSVSVQQSYCFTDLSFLIHILRKAEYLCISVFMKVLQQNYFPPYMKPVKTRCSVLVQVIQKSSVRSLSVLMFEEL